jgi:hypothetical protein
MLSSVRASRTPCSRSRGHGGHRRLSSTIPVVTFIQPLPINSHHFSFRHIGKPAAQPVEKQLPAEFRELKGLSKPLVGRHPAKRLKIHSMVRTWFHVRLFDKTCYHIRFRISQPKFPFHECVYWWAKRNLNLPPPAGHGSFLFRAASDNLLRIPWNSADLSSAADHRRISLRSTFFASITSNACSRHCGSFQ